MKIIRTTTLALLMAFTLSAFSQNNQDSLKVLAIVDLYNQGWYEGDSLKMSKALHPELAKRIISKYKDTGNDVVQNLSYNSMLQYTIAGHGTRFTKEEQNDIVTLLDLYENIACVRVESTEIVEYLQLVRYNNEWKILFVLWDLKPKNS